MTHTNYNLTVCAKDPLDGSAQSTLTLNTTIPEDLARLLQLSGQGAVYTLNVTSNETHNQMGLKVDANQNTTIVSTNPQDILDMVSPTSADCGCDAEDEFAIMEQQAEYDYGSENKDDDHTFDIKDYNFKGRADLPERLTSARYGSNPLKSEMKEGSDFAQMMAKYEEFLAETYANQAGQESPLSAENRDEFAHDPLAGEAPVSDGTRSPLSRIKIQDLPN